MAGVTRACRRVSGSCAFSRDAACSALQSSWACLCQETKALLYNCDGWGSTQQLARSNNLDNVHSVGGSTLLSHDLVTSP